MEEDITLSQEDSDTQMSQLSSWTKRGGRKKATPSTEAVPIKKRGRKRQAPPPTADEDDDDDEEEASQVIPSILKGDKLTPEQEEAAMEWYRHHRDLYAKKSPKYMDTGHKTRLFDAQAKKMGIRCKYNIVFPFIFYLFIFLLFIFFLGDLLSNMVFFLFIFIIFFYFFFIVFLFCVFFFFFFCAKRCLLNWQKWSSKKFQCFFFISDCVLTF